MEYPRFKLHFLEDDLIEHFSLTSDERYLLSQCRNYTNRLGFSVLLKSFQFLGYPPLQKKIYLTQSYLLLVNSCK